MKIVLKTFLVLVAVAAGFFTFFTGTEVSHAQNPNCNVTNISFRTNPDVVPNPNGDDDSDGASNFQEEFYLDNNSTYAYIDIQTTGCIDTDNDPDFFITICVSIVCGNAAPVQVNNNNGTWAFFVGEAGCDVLAYNPDCQVRVKTTDGNSQNDAWPAVLGYDCDVTCEIIAEPPQGLGYIPYGELHPNDEVGVTPGGNGSAEILSEDYLAPLPGLAGQPSGLQGFLQGLFSVLIVIAGILALLMIVIGAVTYVSADSLGGTENGRKMVGNAILGLVLVLGAWVIINTINPNLASGLRITIPKVNIGNYASKEPGVVDTSHIPAGVTPNENAGTSATGSICKDKTFNRVPNCPTCQPIPPGVSISGNSNNQAVPQLGSRLLALENSLPGVNWTVTEAFAPTRAHCGKCHYLGTCIDADFVGLPNPTPAQVKAFIVAAKSLGLRAEWEVRTQAEFNAMVSGGLKPKNEVWQFGSWISGSHFSIYNY